MVDGGRRGWVVIAHVPACSGASQLIASVRQTLVASKRADCGAAPSSTARRSRQQAEDGLLDTC
jgi:hypothetical protein